MLKKLSARHKDMVRRLLVGETPGEICMELGVSESYFSIIQADPIFQARLEHEEAKLSERFISERMDGMEILLATQRDAALLCREAVKDGTVGQRQLRPEIQLKSAWDVLDRTNVSGVQKHVHANLADLVTEAYKKKHGGGNGNGNGDKDHDGSESVTMQNPPSDAITEEGDDSKSMPPDISPPLLLIEGLKQLNLFEDVN